MTLVVGLEGECRKVVEEGDTAAAGGYSGMPVLGTPFLINFLEQAAGEAIKGHLNPNETHVGIRVEVRHLAATPVGMEIRSRARLQAIDRRRLIFAVEAYDEVEKIAEGIHERMVVEAAPFFQRIGQKLLGGPPRQDQDQGKSER